MQPKAQWNLKTNNYKCLSCDYEFSSTQSHYSDHCIFVQLQTAKNQIQDLNKTIAFWKDAWFAQREATGKMAWEVPNPLYLKNTNSEYFQEQYLKFINYAKLLEKK